MEVILTSADLARQENRPDDARKLLERSCDAHPKDWKLHIAEARLEMRLGHSKEALARIRQGLRELPRQPELLWELADVLSTAGTPEEAQAAIHELERENLPPPYLACLRSRLLVREEHWLDAIVKLEGTYADLINMTGQPGNELAETLAEQVGISLGRCLEQVGDADRAYEAFNRVVARNERSVPGRLGMATIRLAQGRHAEALDQYRKLMQLPGAPPIGWLEIARLVLVRNLEGKDASDRNWQEADRALTQAETALKPPPPALAVMRAQYWVAQPESVVPDRHERARQALLKDYSDPKARPIEIWEGLSVVEERQGRPAQGLALLNEAQGHLGDGVQVRLALARYWLRRGRDETPKGLAPLMQGLDRFTQKQRRQLLPGLATACRQAGLTAEARRLWEQFAREQPNDIAGPIAFFDLALGADDAAAADRWQSEIRRIEGADGVVWRLARASALVGRATPGNVEGLAEARRLLSEIEPRRPNWSRVTLCEARLKELEGSSDASLALYLKALQMGERDPSAIGRTVMLLHQQRRDAEATALLSKLPDESLLPPNTQRVAAEVALRSQDSASALARAERAVAADSKNYADQLWLGYMYWATGHLDRVEAALLRSRELAPTAPEVWVARVQFFIATGHKDQALAEVDLARRNLTTPAAAATLAQCFELTGQNDRAREAYQTAIQHAGDDTAVLRAAAGFYLRTKQMQQAKGLLVRLRQKTTDRTAAAWARRTLAVLQAEGDRTKVPEALALLEESDGGKAGPADPAETAQDQRARAQLLTIKNSPQARREAVTILDGLIARHFATPEDYLLAGQLYEAANDWPQARQLYLGVVGLRNDANPQSLTNAAQGYCVTVRPMGWLRPSADSTLGPRRRPQPRRSERGCSTYRVAQAMLSH